MPTATAPELLTTSETSERYKLPDRTLRRLAAEGKLPYVRFGDRGRLRFRVEDVEALLEPRRGQAA